MRGIHDPQVIGPCLKDTAMILWLRGSQPWGHGPVPVSTVGGEWCAREQKLHMPLLITPHRSHYA